MGHLLLDIQSRASRASCLFPRSSRVRAWVKDCLRRTLGPYTCRPDLLVHSSAAILLTSSREIRHFGPETFRSPGGVPCECLLRVRRRIGHLASPPSRCPKHSPSYCRCGRDFGLLSLRAFASWFLDRLSWDKAQRKVKLWSHLDAKAKCQRRCGFRMGWRSRATPQRDNNQNAFVVSSRLTKFDVPVYSMENFTNIHLV